MTNQQPAHIGSEATPGSPPPAQSAPEYPSTHPAVLTVPGLHPGNGLVRVNIQGNSMTSSMVVPTLVLDGQTVASAYGENAFQVPAGPHRVDLFAMLVRPYGKAGIDVVVPPGGVVDVFYAAPNNRFAAGSIGLTKQRGKGAVVAGLILAVLGVGIWALFKTASWFAENAEAIR